MRGKFFRDSGVTYKIGEWRSDVENTPKDETIFMAEIELSYGQTLPFPVGYNKEHNQWYIATRFFMEGGFDGVRIPGPTHSCNKWHKWAELITEKSQ